MNQNDILKKESKNGRIKKIDVFDPILSLWDEERADLRFSKLAHQFKRGNTVALYHSLTHQVIYLDSEVYRSVEEKIVRKKKLTEKDRDIIRELIKQGLLVSQGYDEHKIIGGIRSRFLGKPVFGTLYLLLTDICNLRCRYCHIEGALPENHNFSMMSKETVIKAINLFVRLISRNPKDRRIKRLTITFYGGEPLLNKEAFLVALDEIDRLKKSSGLPSNTIILLLTNATVVDKEIIKAIVEKGVSVSVSLDGPKNLHDANRIFIKNRKGTFQQVIKNVRWLQKAGANVSVSCTISQANIDQLEEVLKWLISEFQIRSLGFNMLLDLPNLTQTDESYTRKATEKLIECYQIAREKGIYEERIMRKIKAFVQKSLHLVDCSGCGNQIVVTPDGKIGPCQAYISSGKFFPGRIDDEGFNPFQDPVFIEWSRRSPFNIPKCQFCSGIGLCGGGCPYNTEVKLGDIWKVDQNFCFHTKKTLEWLLWDLFEKTKIKEVKKDANRDGS